MKRRRRCCVCRELFMPDPRVGDRQRACSRDPCQTERHRRACAEWRARERPAVEAQRVRVRLGSPDLSRAAVKDAMGSKAAVVIEEVFILVARGARDGFTTKQLDLSGESFRLVDRPRRDATAVPGPGP